MEEMLSGRNRSILSDKYYIRTRTPLYNYTLQSGGGNDAQLRHLIIIMLAAIIFTIALVETASFAFHGASVRGVALNHRALLMQGDGLKIDMRGIFPNVTHACQVMLRN